MLCVAWVLLEKEKLITGLILSCLSIVLLVYAIFSVLAYIKDKHLKEMEVVLNVLSEEFETTDIFIVKEVESGENYERYEVVVEDELLEIIFIDDESGEKRVVVDD